MVAAECIARVNAVRAAMQGGPHDAAFDPPWSTIQVNRIEGGEALNIVAAACRFFWEMRVLPGVDDRAVLAGLEQTVAAEIVPAMQAVDPACGVRFEVLARIPALAACDPGMESRLLHVLGQNGAVAVAYGSEAGHVPGRRDAGGDHRPRRHRAGAPAGGVACTREQLEACGPVLERLRGGVLRLEHHPTEPNRLVDKDARRPPSHVASGGLCASTHALGLHPRLSRPSPAPGWKCA